MNRSVKPGIDVSVTMYIAWQHHVTELLMLSFLDYSASVPAVEVSYETCTYILDEHARYAYPGFYFGEVHK